MSWDLFDVVEAAGATRDEPMLIEVATARARGRAPRRGFVWSTGRVIATVGDGRVRIARRLGVMSDGLALDLDELHALALATADWAAQRERWAAFYFSCSGYPAGCGGAYWYEPPGAAPRQKLGTHTIGGRTGEQLVGRDELVAIAPSTTSRAPAIAEIWRRGERHGPSAGSLVGLRYRLAPGLQLDAKRDEAVVARGKDDRVYLEPGEERFVAELLDVLAGK